ncbi:MAG TPA: MFS transporter [Thermoanaerobaculia bacterium]|nr:MFS transporter [Thermoanaerobaculia bacterium]
MPAASPTPPDRKRARLTLVLTVFLDLLGFGMILPILPFYGQEYGASDFQVGILFAAYSASQLVFSPLLGRLSDRLGRRPLLLASIALNVVAHTSFAFAPSFGLLVAARALSGLAAANIGIAMAYMADVSPRAERSKAMGLLGAAFGLGFVLGPAFGGMLSFVSQIAVPLGAAALALVNLALASVLLPESLSFEARRDAADGRWFDVQRLAAVVGDVPLFSLMLLAFVVTVCFAMMEASLALFAQELFGWGGREISWLFVWIGVLIVGIQGGLIGVLVRRVGERWLLNAGVAIVAVGLLVMAFSSRPLHLLVATGLLAVGLALHNPTYTGLLSRLTDDASQGGVLGLSRSFSSLARVIGPLAGTALFERLGASAPFLWGGCLLLLATLAAYWIARRAVVAVERREAAEAEG